MIKGFLNLPWFFWAGLALLIAVIYSFFWPHKLIMQTSGLRFFIVRWGHAIVWILLTVNFVMRGLSTSLNGAANLIASIAGLIYLLFMAMTFLVK
jgi:hypothetical protein